MSVRINEDLLAALEDLYRVFADRRPNGQVDASPLKDAERIAQLTASPLRDVPASVIEYYVDGALWTIGDARDFLHFLPRALEVAVREPGLGDPLLVATKLTMVPAADWADPKRSTVITFYQRATHAAAITNPAKSIAVIDWLHGCGVLGLPAAPLLAEWLRTPYLNATLQMATAITQQVPMHIARGDWNDVDPAFAAAVADWIGGTAVQERMLADLDRLDAGGRDLVETAFMYL
ncbi:hypothetical protein [Methylobrevis albus]|uniref:Uncharacterized protein n=1 Tax=Methylobrevis albus TaxID=2793297 RepID=A0A931MZ30_9HYPH|nr:hypothetical protein [Methylobrevis albus]MBH0237579.1 hypothetical protein [Methylobrevis albus]